MSTLKRNIAILLLLFSQSATELAQPSQIIINQIISILESERIINSKKYYIQNHTDGLFVNNLDLAFCASDSTVSNSLYGTDEPAFWQETDFKLQLPKRYSKKLVNKRNKVLISSIRHHEIGSYITVIVYQNKVETISILFNITEDRSVNLVRKVVYIL